MDRRTFLACGATAVGSVTGGCTAFSGTRRDGVALTHVELGNASGEPQTFDLLVFRDGEIVHWSTREVESGEGGQTGGEVIEMDAADEYGRVEVYVRIGDERTGTDFEADEYDGERVIAVVTYGAVEDDMLRISRRLSDRPVSDAE